MSLVKKIPLWLQTGILYGLSWPIFEDINLSFLAWFAFVPLFIFLENNKNKFWKSIIGSFASLVVFSLIAAFWLFQFPQDKAKIAIIFVWGEFWLFFPFLIFYFVQKKLKFEFAIWLLPLIWMISEWAYLDLEFTMGTHLSAYTQSNNLWLIQFIDITGMWGISFWIMLFNVLIFKALKKVNYRFNHILFYKKIGVIALFMLGIPLMYSMFSYYKYGNLNGKKINITVVPTEFSARYLLNASNAYSVVEQTLYKTDAFAFGLKDKKQRSDLYVWPETGLPFTMQESNLNEILSEAVTDWQSALLTGVRGITDTTNLNDKRQYVSGILMAHENKKPQYHHKTILTPGQEIIPYHKLLSKIPNFPIKLTDPRYFKKGEKSEPLTLITKDNQEFKVGVSLCYEQWYPKHWAALARNGADFYTHLAAEGWYGKVGFKKFMVNVSRMRCIENRKQTARAANVGFSGFIDQMGNLKKHSNTNSLQPINSSVTASKVVTFYAKYPNWFPLVGLGAFLLIIFIHFLNLKTYSHEKISN